MLQLTRTSHGNEIQAHEEMPAMMMFDDEDNISVEEMTTAAYDSSTEMYPPIVLSTAGAREEASTSFLMKLVGFEPTEPTVDVPTEVIVMEMSDPIHEDRMKKPRLLEAEESIVRSGHVDEDAFRHFLPEETTIFVPIEDENMNETEITEDLDDTTIFPPLVKPTKGPKIYKTRPNELLRHYVEDSHLRSPIAALIDKKRNPLSKAKKLWKAALKPNSLLDIMVVSYDSEGKHRAQCFRTISLLTERLLFAGIKSTYNLTNTRAMMSTLERVREENATVQESKTYYSIIRTGQLIPYDSAIFLSTDNLPNDTEHQNQASMILLKKRIRVSRVENVNREWH